MKKNYQKPTMNVAEMQHMTMILVGSNDNVINPGEPNKPAATRGFDDWDNKDVWNNDDAGDDY